MAPGQTWLERAWYGGGAAAWLLLPLTLVYAAVTGLRRQCYRAGLLRSRRIPAPVVVVGNISVGGTGKTPVTLFLAEALAARGLKPGIVSRGYGRDADTLEVVADDSPASQVGDEPLLLKRRAACPVVVAADRVAAAEKVLALGANVVIADDGLQHYRLQRDAELCVVDAARSFGNGLQLPAGPLREPLGRLNTVDAVLVNTTGSGDAGITDGRLVEALAFTLGIRDAVRLADGKRRTLESFAGEPVYAVAGIGHPERFFTALEGFGLTLIRHPLPDHAGFDPAALDSARAHDILLTEKDAVKLAAPFSGREWYVPAQLEMDEAGAQRLLTRLDAVLQAAEEAAGR